MRHYDQRRKRYGPAAQAQTVFRVGDQVSIVRAPLSYVYNGRAGVVVAVDGQHIHVQVEDPPGDMACTVFYAEELAHAGDAAADDAGGQP
ncbi:MAG: hypothetical protein DIU80_010215 [Chloroflexota bacterium]